MGKIYNKEEFTHITDLESSMIDKLLAERLIRPAGKIDGVTPYFDEANLEAAEAISKLLKLGYSVDEVARIRRKVGLPSVKSSKSNDGNLLTVGELAKRIKSNPRTIKHWEEKGIIEPDSHSPGGFRLYYERYVQVCELIQDLQAFGYTLEEIKAVADLTRDFIAIRADIHVIPHERVIEKLEEIKERQGDLLQRISRMENGIRRCRGILKQNQKEMALITKRLDREKRKPKTSSSQIPSIELDVDGAQTST